MKPTKADRPPMGRGFKRRRKWDVKAVKPTKADRPPMGRGFKRRRKWDVKAVKPTKADRPPMGRGFKRRRKWDVKAVKPTKADRPPMGRGPRGGHRSTTAVQGPAAPRVELGRGAKACVSGEQSGMNYAGMVWWPCDK